MRGLVPPELLCCVITNSRRYIDMADYIDECEQPPPDPAGELIALIVVVCIAAFGCWLAGL